MVFFQYPQQSTFWKRNVYEKVGGFNINNHTCMDGEFFAFAAANNFSFKMINKILAGFRIHPSSKTGNKKSELKLSYRSDQEKFINTITAIKNIRVNKFLQTLYRWKYIPYKMYIKSRAKF